MDKQIDFLSKLEKDSQANPDPEAAPKIKSDIMEDAMGQYIIRDGMKIYFPDDTSEYYRRSA